MNRIKVRITNDSTRYPRATKVELIIKAEKVGLDDETLDLTYEGVVHWPIITEINADGMFAILKLPLESVEINAE